MQQTPSHTFPKSSDFDYIIYHKDCYDGIGGAFITFLKNRDIKFIPLKAGSEFPKAYLNILKGKKVIMVDISFKREDTIALHSVCSKLVILDHHKTSQESLRGLEEYTIFDMNESGISLSWKFFFGYAQPLPAFLEYIGLRDLWKHQTNENALYFTTGLLKENNIPTIDLYMKFYNNNDNEVNKMIQKGKEYHISMIERIKIIVLNDIQFKWEDYNTHIIYITNNDYNILNEIGSYISEKYPKDIVLLCRKDTPQRNSKIRFCLRSYSNSGPDVSIIAKKFGGGGHEHASGFILSKEILATLNYFNQSQIFCNI